MLWLRQQWKSFLANPWQPWYLLLILAVNIPGSAYGYYWYAEQLASTPGRLLLFVPDSPLATTLLSMALILSLLGYKNRFLSLLGCATCIKYGLWAVVVITDFWLRGGALGWETVLLCFSHLGMAVQGVIFMRADSSFSPAGGMALAAAGVSAWMLMNDFVDYSLGVYPYLYYYGQEPVAAVSAWVLSAAVIIYVFIIFRKTVR
ncbi:MAG: hypothetical protein JL50_18415 [Peptococcaceae bacterium BICA1-7]|nr:MAG: hypothetical protein JL50_18415 [Peptococcaceae bacterium BICA1-7]